MATFSSLLSEEQFLCSICVDVFTEPVSIPCGHNFYICSGMKLKALKSCLVCQTSYCETHLEPHQRVPALKRHKLINPVENLEDRMCKKHERLLELFCRTDQTYVLKTLSLEEEYGERKAQLEKTEAEVKQMIQERLQKVQEIKHSVDLSKREAEREISDSVQVFTDLVRSIERSQAELIEVTEKKLEAAERQAEGLIKELEQEITELKRRSTELEQLSHTEDHLHLLQSCPSLYAELKRIQQYAVDVTLDPDTAHLSLILSDDGKQVRHRKTSIHLPDNPKMFDCCGNVLGKEGFSSGRFYYEVTVNGKTDWTLGVARESINRKEKITLTHENGYWTVRLRNGNEYIANSIPTKPQKVGVFVDCEEGQVSFYDVEARSHIYSFTDCTFAEKLYPYFCLCPNYGSKNSAPLITSPGNHTD
uniref:B30.2/SPRY domain-containing protein n=1 Tax=Salmo trutta TaxID=8032 RepID=A0A674E3Z3_SALTR